MLSTSGKEMALFHFHCFIRNDWCKHMFACLYEYESRIQPDRSLKLPVFLPFDSVFIFTRNRGYQLDQLLWNVLQNGMI